MKTCTATVRIPKHVVRRTPAKKTTGFVCVIAVCPVCKNEHYIPEPLPGTRPFGLVCGAVINESVK